MHRTFKPYSYCAKCYKPFHSDLYSTCKACGSKTTISLHQKVDRDNSFTAAQRRWLHSCALITGLAQVFNIVWNIAVLVIFFNYSDNILFLQNISKEFDAEASFYFWAVVIILIIFIVISAAGALFSLLLALKQEWALDAVLYFCRFLWVYAIIFGNIISALPAALIVHNVTKIIQKAEHGFTYDEKGNIIPDKDPEPLVQNYDERKCKGCGYINASSVLECKSCGKFK